MSGFVICDISKEKVTCIVTEFSLCIPAAQ